MSEQLQSLFYCQLQVLGARTHTHTRFDCNIRSAPGDVTPHTFASLYMGFEINIWVVHYCVFLNLQSCSEQPLQQFQNKKKKKKKKINKLKKKHEIEEIFSPFCFTHYRYTTRKRGSFCNAVAGVVVVRCRCSCSLFHSTSVVVSSNVRNNFVRHLSQFRSMSIIVLSDVHCHFVDAPYF